MQDVTAVGGHLVRYRFAVSHAVIFLVTIFGSSAYATELER